MPTEGVGKPGPPGSRAERLGFFVVGEGTAHLHCSGFVNGAKFSGRQSYRRGFHFHSLVRSNMLRLLLSLFVLAFSAYSLSGCAPKDCKGVRGGSATLDACGVCDGHNECLDCAGVRNGQAEEDACGVCEGKGPPDGIKELCGFVRIKAGTFWMGSSRDDISHNDDEILHRVTLTKDFYLMKHEVTQGDYRTLMFKKPSKFSSCGSNCPVEKVSWYDAVAYANALSDKEGLTRCYSGSTDNIRWDKSCNGYRLPTEAEWEYAARAGQETWFAGSNSADEVAWYYKGIKDNSGDTTHPVGQKKPNAWGLYDMSGNVYEWCWDWYGPYLRQFKDPTGPRSGEFRVIRGGSWSHSAEFGRVEGRGRKYLGLGESTIGFRLARTAQ